MKDDKSTQWHSLVLALKDYAQRENISQEEIANRSGLKASSISRVFNLKFSPNLKTLFIIADALGVEITITPKNG